MLVHECGAVSGEWEVGIHEQGVQIIEVLKKKKNKIDEKMD